MKRILVFVLVDTIWILGFLVTLSMSSFPILLLGNLIYSEFAFNGLMISIPFLGFMWINLYILIVGALHYVFVPNLKEGRFRILGAQWIKWRLNWILYSYVFLFFNRYLLFNKFIKTPFLKLMGVQVYYTTYFGETANLQDLNNLLSFGKNTLIGSEVIMATHLTISEKNIIFKKVTIGDNTLIGARTCIAPGVTVGNNVIIAYGVSISLSSSIGDGTQIDGLSSIQSNVRIGKNCKIGFKSVIEANTIISDDTIIPAYSIWSSKMNVAQDGSMELVKLSHSIGG